MVTFLISKGHLNPIQHAFRGECSCLSALLSVFDDVMKLLSSGDNTEDILTDGYSAASNCKPGPHAVSTIVKCI